MSDLRVLCTNTDGSVTIVIPAPECVQCLGEGGAVSTSYSRWRVGFHRYLLQQWPHHWLGWLMGGDVPLSVARAWEIHKFVSDERWRRDRTPAERKGLAAYWIDALIAGGLDERQAVWLIGEKDAPAFSVAHEIVHMSEIPSDRRHRSAWRRSTNGGPIWTDDGKAQDIDEAQLWAAYETQQMRV